MTLVVALILTGVTIYDLAKLIYEREPVIAICAYLFLMLISITISVLILSGKRPVGPNEIIELIFKAIGVIT